MIEQCDSLTSLAGMVSLHKVGASIHITNCNSLTSMAGLESLTSIGLTLDITGCGSLASLHGIDNIAAGSIYTLNVTGNGALSSCAMHNICDLLANPNGSIAITGNAAGCNSPQEVQDSCTLSGTLPAGSGSLPEVWPNPASSLITVGTFTKGNIYVLNTAGRQVLGRSVTEPATVLYVGSLPAGVYVIRVVEPYKARTMKLVIE